MGRTSGRMGRGTLGNGLIIPLMGSGSTSGRMGGRIEGSGGRMLWTGSGCTRGLMERSILENIRIIKRMVMEFLYFPLAESILDTGKMEKATVSERTLQMAYIINLASGKTGNKINGLTNKKLATYKMAPKISDIISKIH